MFSQKYHRNPLYWRVHV